MVSGRPSLRWVESLSCLSCGSERRCRGPMRREGEAVGRDAAGEEVEEEEKEGRKIGRQKYGMKESSEKFEEGKMTKRRKKRKRCDAK